MALLAASAIAFLLALNGRRVTSIKVAGNEVSTAAAVPAPPTPSDVKAVEENAATAEEQKDATDGTDSTVGAVTRTVGSVSSYRLDDVPLHVLGDAFVEIQKQAPDKTRTLASVNSVLKNPGKGQPWFVKLTDESLWRLTYAGNRKAGESGTAKVTRVKSP